MIYPNYLIYLFYTDPGSGYLIVQLLLAALLGLGFYWKKFKEKIFGKKPDSENDEKLR